MPRSVFALAGVGLALFFASRWFGGGYVLGLGCALVGGAAGRVWEIGNSERECDER